MDAEILQKYQPYSTGNIEVVSMKKKVRRNRIEESQLEINDYTILKKKCRIDHTDKEEQKDNYEVVKK